VGISEACSEQVSAIMDRDIGSKLRDHNAQGPQIEPQRMPTAWSADSLVRRTLNASSDSHEEGREGRDWLRERVYRYAERVLFASGLSDELQIRDQREGAPGSDHEDMGGESARARVGGSWRRMFLRWCWQQLEIRALTQLADQLSQCVRNAHRLESSWKLEFTVSARMLPRTQVKLLCEPPRLRLRFECSDPAAQRLLLENQSIFDSRLGSLTRYQLTVEIERSDEPQPHEGSRSGE
jgi:hypothetical protein